MNDNPKPETLLCGRFRLTLDRPLIMGVVNITPDSFSDGGQYFDSELAIAHARELIAEGADILDIGGESSRPGSMPVPLEEERRRVLPVLSEITGLGVPVSVDTTKPQLMRDAIRLGASIINDITALSAPGAADVIAETDAGVCLMHMQGTPESMQRAPRYGDVVSEVADFLCGQARVLRERGVAAQRIIIDPGFGFGKSDDHNLLLLNSLSTIAARGYAVLAGLSRKSQLGRMTGRPEPQRRLGSSIAAALAAVSNGASIVRVHDVAETRDALLVWQAIERAAANKGASSR